MYIHIVLLELVDKLKTFRFQDDGEYEDEVFQY